MNEGPALPGAGSNRPDDGQGLDLGKVAAARLWVTTQYPYMASAVFASPVLPAPGLGRIMIDRWWRVHADPQVVADASVNQLGGELLHLSGHLLRDHAGRADGVGLSEQSELHHWVDAADAEIHDDFGAEAPRIEASVAAADLDAGEGRLAEEYYRRGSVREANDNDCGSGVHGRVAAWEPPPPTDGQPGVGHDEQELLRRRVAADIARAAADEASASLRSWADEVLHPSTDWRRELAALLRRSLSVTAGAVDYSYRRPSRRAGATSGVVLPALRRPTVEVAVICDTSASVDDRQLAVAVTEIDGILRSVGSRSVRVLACDSAVQTVRRVTRGRDVSLAGGGGTDMAVGIDAATALRPSPDVVIVVTDGFTPWPDAAPTPRVLVALLHSPDSLPPPEAPSWASVVSVGEP